MDQNKDIIDRTKDFIVLVSQTQETHNGKDSIDPKYLITNFNLLQMKLNV